MSQLTFKDENDFSLSEYFKEKNDGTVEVKHGNWVGSLWPGFTRTTQDENGEEITIDVWVKYCELRDNGTIIIEPVDLSLIKEQAKQTINQLREQYISGGVTYEVSGTTYTFQTNPQSIMDLTGAVISGSDVTWLTSDNTPVVMTNAQLIGLGQAVAAHKESYVYQARTHKDNIEACTTKAEIDTYMTSLSWT